MKPLAFVVVAIWVLGATAATTGAAIAAYDFTVWLWKLYRPAALVFFGLWMALFPMCVGRATRWVNKRIAS